MHRRRVLTGLGVLALGSLVACAAPVAGPAATESRPISGVSEVHLAGIGTLLVSQGATESLTIEAEPRLLPAITTEVRGGRLIIGMDRGRGGTVGPLATPRYHLTLRQVSALDLSGPGAIEAANIAADRLRVRLSGAGSARLDGLQTNELGATLSGTGSLIATGTARQQTIGISGAGGFQGERLQAATADVALSGIGGAVVRVSDYLSVHLSGVGGVTYIGNPTVRQQISGLGGVARRSE
jgi:hypothetical protein